MFLLHSRGMIKRLLILQKEPCILVKKLCFLIRLLDEFVTLEQQLY